MKTIALIFGAVLLRFLFVSPFMFLFWWIRRSVRKLRPREDGVSIEFSLAPRMHILIEIVIVSLVAFTALIVWETIRKGGGLYAALIPLSVLVAILLAEPRRILVNDEGIRQHRWLRGDRVIAWNEIVWMRRGRNTGSTYLKSRNGGRAVSFSPLLVGQSRFEREVRKRAREIELD
jgi:drug/metabolite transporter (DMT)-like permease